MFNDLRLKGVTDYPQEDVAKISFVGLNYPTMKQVWDLNREIRASKLSAVDTSTSPWGPTSTFGLTHSAPYKSTLAIPSIADTNTSSHCAMVHVPPLPLFDGKSNFSAVQCDLVIRGTFEMDFTCPKDTKSHNAPHALGEIWDDTVDPTVCPYGGYGLKEFAKGKANWVTEVGAYIKKVL